MNRTACRLSALSALTFVFSLGVGAMPKAASAAPPILDSVLGFDQPDCCHVIDLLMRNRICKSMGLLPGTPLPHLASTSQLGDLVLLDVHLVAEGDAAQGPVYQVSFRNAGQCAIRDFRISVVGVLCRITPTSPCRMVNVSCIEAGETKCVEIQLPTTAMAMGTFATQPQPFDTLIVAIDSFDELVECNESNNVAILKRAEIALVIADGPANPAAAPNPPADATPAPTEEPTPDTTPGDKAIPSPLGNIDLDDLDLDDKQETALRIALETM